MHMFIYMCGHGTHIPGPLRVAQCEYWARKLNIDRDEIQRGRMLPEVVLVPIRRLPLRVAKYDVVIREGPLQAVLAKQTMLTRM